MALVDGGGDEDEDETLEDTINRHHGARKKLLPNASYFAFTATPKNKTLEIFGEPCRRRTARSKHRPFHSYTMKQAIQEGFILDVLEELHAGRQLLQAGQEDRGRPGVRHQEGAEEAAPVRREPRPRDPAQGRDHGRPLPRAGAGAEQDRRPGAGDGGDQRHRAGDPVLPRHSATTCAERKSPYQAIVAFSGEHEYGGAKVTRGVAQRLSERATSPTRSRRIRTAS